jgi:putative transposase
MDTFAQSETRQDNGFTTLTAISGLHQPSGLSVIPESAPTNSAETLTGKPPRYEKSIQIPKQYRTLVLDLTSNERVLSPYWNEAYQEKSSALLLRGGTDWLGSDLTSLNGWSNGMGVGSWFSIKSNPHPNPSLPLTLSPLLLASLPECTDCEVTVMRSKKILLKPTAEQKQKFRQWMGTYRFVYNFTVSRIKNDGDKPNYMASRKVWTAMLPPWVKTNGCPAHTVYGAMMDACKAFQSNYAKGGKFDVGYLSRREQKSFFILGNGISPKGIYPRLLGEIKAIEPLPDKPCDSRIMVIAGKFYLCVPRKEIISRQPENQGTTVISVDPGVRTFLTCYSENEISKIGEGDCSRIIRLCLNLDDLISRTSKAPKPQRKPMRLAAARMRQRIHNLIDELHYKSIRFLLRFDCVILPVFNGGEMARKAKRKIRSKTVRKMLTLSHSVFRSRLLHKAFIAGKRVILVSESYTSKTANWTGEMMPKLGGAKFIKSEGVKIDRDINGALGIFLKGFVGSTYQQAAELH